MPQDTWQTHQEWIRRQCASDWQQFEGDTPLHEALDLFYRVAQLPVDDPDLNGFWEQLLTAVEGYRQASDCDRRISCLRDLAVAAETCLKRIVKLAAPETYATLGRPAEPGRPPREPMFTDLLDFPGLGLITDASRRIYRDFAWRARNIRNKLSHATPELSELEVARAFVDFWLTMLWATVKYKRELESLLFVLPRKSYLEKLLQRWQEYIRRWVLLDAEELPAHEESGLAERTARELPQKVHELFKQVGRLILIADAGAGKTTSLQHYACLQARSLLDNPRQFRPVPIYVELRYYRYHPEGGLWHLLRKALGSNGSQVDGGFEQFRREIAEGKWILLLDGLNEVQGDLQEQALRELEQLIGENPQARLVITSRRDMPLHRLSLPVFQLDFLTDEQRVEFLRRHFPNEPEADAFIQTLRHNPRLWDWGRNPLQLWMLVQVGLMAGGGLPQNRGQLLRRFVEYLLEREEGIGPQIPRDIKLDLLSELGYQTRQAGRVSFPRLQAWQIVKQRCQEMGYEVDSARFVREVCDNHLLGDQGEQLAFAHEMYQDYFAACGLKWRYEADPQAIESLRGQPQWREPLVLLYGLLQNPDNLFQWLVRNEPEVAAECLASAAQPKDDEQKQLRQRILQVDYRTASDDELRKVLEAIYILGDGALLAQHLQLRQRHNRLKGIGREIAEAFTGDERALRATLEALQHLGKSASVFSQRLLQPLQGKDLEIPAELQREASQLWRTWRYEYTFSPIDLLLLGLAFRLQNLLAEEICRFIEWLLDQGHWEAALGGIRAFGLAARYPPEPIIERLLQQGQWEAALWGIKASGLAARYPPEPIIEKLLQQGHWRAALWGIESFGLATRYPPEPIIENLLQQGQWESGLWGILAFGLQREAFAQAAAEVVRRLLEQGQWHEALRAIQAFGLQREAFAEAAAAEVERLLKQGRWDEALRGIQAFALQREAFAEAAAAKVQELLRQGRWDAAVASAEQFQLWNLVHDYLAECIRAGREASEQSLSWLKKNNRRIRNGIATVLLRRYGDVENALAVVGSLGFTREHIEHNLALIERVETICQAVAQMDELPEGEDMRDRELELFGYVHESGCILAPGFRDFRISESAKQHGLAGRVVRFWLVVERHPADNRPVLNATNLVPV